MEPRDYLHDVVDINNLWWAPVYEEDLLQCSIMLSIMLRQTCNSV